MKRYIYIEEYFGARVYDSQEKKEYYFDKNSAETVKKLIADSVEEIFHKKRENSFSAPLKISMNLTKKCNLRCKQCFSDSGEIRSQELTTKEVFKLFDDMRNNGTFFICLGGGEPFTRQDLMEILEYGKQKQLAVSIVSNGLLLTKELLEELNTKDVDYLWVSFEGLKDNHEYLRGNGTFAKTLNALRLIQKYYKGRTAIRMSLNKHNINEWKEIIKIAEDYNIDLVRFTPLLSYGRAKNEDLVISQDQYIEFLKEIKDAKSDKVKIVYPNMSNKEKIWIGTNGFGCHCGKEAIWVDEEGNYSPCFFWGNEYILGNLRTSDYMDLWEKSLLVTNFKGNDVCKNCKNYKVCRGGCRVRVLDQLGNLDDVDPLCPLRKNKIIKSEKKC